MSRPKKFNDYSYGVGLEYNASSYKQVKDAMKDNMDDLLKLAKSYSEAIKVDPSIDISKMISALKELATIIDQTEKSGNPFSEFIDKGVLNRVSNLEQNMQSLTRTSSELKETIEQAFGEIKNIGKLKFPGTFDEIFGYKKKEAEATLETIKALTDEIDKLRKIQGPSVGTFNRSTKEQGIQKASVKDLESWINKYKELESEAEDLGDDVEKVAPILKEMRELGMKIKEALTLPNIKNSKGFSDYQSFLKEASKFFENSVDDFNANIKDKITDLREQRQALENEFTALKESANKLGGQVEANKKQANKKGATNLGKLDQIVDVSVKPKVDAAVWSDTINKKLAAVQDKLNPVVLKATFSNKSKNLEKELDGNIAAINHTVKAEFKIEDNFGDESDPNSFFGKLRKLDTDLQEAKDKLSSKTQFKVRFAFESADGSVVTNVKSYVQNQFRNIPVTLQIKNGKSFMTSIANMISGVKGNFEKSLTDIPISFKIKNEEELLESVNKLKESISTDMDNVGVSFVTNGIINIGDAAINAAEDVEKLSNSVEKLNNNSKKKSKSVELMFKEYDELADKLNIINSNPKKLLEIYGSGDAGFKKYQKDVKRFESLEKELGPRLEEHLKSKTLDKLSDSAVSAQVNINKIENALKDLNKVKVDSEYFIKIGFIDENSQQIGDPAGYLQRRLEERDKLNKQIQQEMKAPGSVYKSNKSGQEQYRKDTFRLTYLENELKAVLDDQINWLKQKGKAYKQTLEASSKELSLQKKPKGSKADIAQDAANATKEYAKLNDTIQKTETILKGLNSSKSILNNNDKAFQFIQLGEWDKDTKKFKRNKEEMKKLFDDYRDLHKANKAAKITDVNNPNLKKELELRDKIKEIIKEQKKHLRESLKEQNKQKEAALKTLEVYKKAPTSESINSKKNNTTNIVVDDIKNDNVDIKKLQNKIKEQEKIINSLNSKGRNSEYFAKLGAVDKNTKEFKKNTAEIEKMLARYRELAAMKQRTKAQDAEKNKLNGQLTQILIAQKKQANEILEKNKQDLAVLQNKEKSTNKVANKGTTKKATNKKTATTIISGATVEGLSDDKLNQLIDVTNKILSEIKSSKSKTKTQANISNTDKTSNITTGKQSNRQIISLSQRLGKVTAQRDALPENSVERVAIEDRIKLIRKEILEKQKSAKADKQLMLAAFELGQEEQKISTNIARGRKEDTKVVKEETKATKELLALYQRLGQIDAEMSTKNGYEKLALEDERSRIQSQINAKKTPITNSEIEAYVKAREAAEIQVNKRLAKIYDKTDEKKETSNIRELTNAYLELGKMQADLEHTTGSRARKNLEEQIEKQKLLIQEKQKGINVDENLLDSQRIIAYNKRVDKLRLSEAKRFDKAEEADKKDLFKNIYGLKEINAATQSRNNIRGQALGDDFKDSSVILGMLNNIDNAYNKLIAKQQQFKDANPTQNEIDEFKILEEQYNRAVVKLDEVIKSSRRLTDQALDGKIMNVEGDVGDLKQALINAAQTFDGTGIKVIDFDENLKRLEYTVRRQDGTLDHFAVALTDAGNQIIGVSANVKQVDNVFSSFLKGSWSKFKNAMQVFSGYDLFFEGIAQVKQGIQYIREINSAMIELRKVTNETEETYARFLQTASKTADRIGSTVKDVTTMTADWSRLKYLGLLYGDI